MMLKSLSIIGLPCSTCTASFGPDSERRGRRKRAGLIKLAHHGKPDNESVRLWQNTRRLRASQMPYGSVRTAISRCTPYPETSARPDGEAARLSADAKQPIINAANAY